MSWTAIYVFFFIALAISGILKKVWSKKLYPDKKDYEHKMRLENVIDATFLATCLWWLIASTLLSFIDIW